MKKLPTIMHVEQCEPGCLAGDDLGFRRINAAEATHVILASEHFRELARAAAEARVQAPALDALKEVLVEIFEKCPTAAGVYFDNMKKREEEKKNADV